MLWTPDRKKKSTEKSCFYYIFNIIAFCDYDQKLDRSYSTKKNVLNLSLFFYGLVCRCPRELTTWIRTTSQVAYTKRGLCRRDISISSMTTPRFHLERVFIWSFLALSAACLSSCLEATNTTESMRSQTSAFVLTTG